MEETFEGVTRLCHIGRLQRAVADDEFAHDLAGFSWCLDQEEVSFERCIIVYRQTEGVRAVEDQAGFLAHLFAGQK